MRLPLSDIRVGKRDREDLGDLAGLQASITAVGLLHPVVVTQDGDLVAGGRRLAAVTGLGWETVPVTVVTLATAAEVLRAEEDENTCRKPLTPYEAAQARERRAALLVPAAEGRMRRGKPLGPSPNLGEGVRSAESTPAGRPDARTAKVAAVGTGFSGSTLDKVDQIRTCAERGVIRRRGQEVPVPDVVRTVAQEALTQVQRSGIPVDRQHQRLREALAAYLDGDPELHRNQLRKSVARLTHQTMTGLPLLDAALVAEVCEGEQGLIEGLTHAVESLTAWVAEVQRLRPRGLRVVGGAR